MNFFRVDSDDRPVLFVKRFDLEGILTFQPDVVIEFVPVQPCQMHATSNMYAFASQYRLRSEVLTNRTILREMAQAHV
jgi:hypothetical protein